MDVLIDSGYRGQDVLDLVDVEGLVGFAVRTEGKPDASEVSISFVDNERMHELNRDYRGIDRPTDVLSFECDNLDDGFDIDRKSVV